MEYIEASRINRSHGQIGGIKDGILLAGVPGCINQILVEVELSVNGAVCAKTKANEWREHGKGVRNKRDGYCGYRFNLRDYGVKVGDEVLYE